MNVGIGSYPLLCPLDWLSFHLYHSFCIVSKPRILKESFWQWHVPLLFPNYLTQIHSSKFPHLANSHPYHHLQLIWPKYSASIPSYHVRHFLPTHLLVYTAVIPQGLFPPSPTAPIWKEAIYTSFGMSQVHTHYRWCVVNLIVYQWWIPRCMQQDRIWWRQTEKNNIYYYSMLNSLHKYQQMNKSHWLEQN